ncbi:MAG: acylphosphatase [Balneolaceae bacterium]|nr:acylphosphatase [Balneolaceae bacterium]MBO6545760.1 acylphosphatase [Balneolaceae bacterium]MBO6647156.1 acylphosphatase [Balneolaceae bacterium]
MKIAKHILIKGRVQGVGFRYFTKKHAANKGIKGWVRNLRDGRVEAIVQGSKEDVDQMLSILSTGPIHSKVINMEVEDSSVEDLKDFEVRY